MDINRLVKVLEDGEVAVVPTETVYGIVGDATRDEVVHKIYDIKNRDYSKPLTVMVSSREMIEDYVREISDIEDRLIKEYCPGKLTILFKKNNKISDLVTNGGDLVGLIWPNNKELIEVIERFGKPIIATSANISSKQTITRVDMLEPSIHDKVSYVYDGGEILNSSSTIVRVNNGNVEIIREGELAEQIREEFKKDQ